MLLAHSITSEERRFALAAWDALSTHQPASKRKVSYTGDYWGRHHSLYSGTVRLGKLVPVESKHSPPPQKVETALPLLMRLTSKSAPLLH